MDDAKTWQEELAEMIDSAPAEKQPRIRDFLRGYLTALEQQQEEENHEEDRV